MKVAVTGATGFIGRYIVCHLVKQGHVTGLLFLGPNPRFYTTWPDPVKGGRSKEHNPSSKAIRRNRMRLVDLVKQECEVEDDEGIVLFRHTKKDTEVVERFGASVNEWTSIQPINPKYDSRQDGLFKRFLKFAAGKSS